MDFSGLINDLQDWEHSMKGKGEKVKVQSQDGKKVGSRSANFDALNKTEPKVNAIESSRNARKLYMGSDAINEVSSSLFTEENSPNATSEKELGNEYFNQKKYNEAIDCYSRSIALSPTAVAFANRAMAYLKIKRFKDAENDCTEALNLDDHYIKAYSRRATARRELGELKTSFKDLEFALKLEPDNQELKKQYADAKALYSKEISDKVSGMIKKAALEKQVGASTLKTSRIEEDVHKVSNPIKKATLEKQAGPGTLKAGHTKVPGISSVIIEEIENQAENATSSSTVLKSDRAGISSSNILKKGDAVNKQEKRILLQDVASKASSLARSKAAKNIAPPKSAYQFESSWRGLSGDHTLQARFLKAIAPVDLPKLFGNALSSPVLIDIMKCVSTFFIEEIELSIGYLDNLTYVSRFDVIIMCVSAADKAELYNLWEMVFSNEAVPIQYQNKICSLRSKYLPKCV